ncbi:hypothetical protein SS1G_08123 [Sclerotinia sclerotiorum 1980 UF-70]|uniref:Major facilitator superfamily (MFS) profile domain-containing protein n=1 Tax=Sclerotinia sclerotiorum (strain ATCC 18683 / 1980 / Ss-1) TaxID=665079 RepID=A7ES18_SCLS1|nr:hypothetical protein SS1G_08123 [Sclerotinia sclerotiorum 1980 UF-70]EDN92260.1 hypothetical protein SS1G_08123 [Sclerotinia sclerotiorum 1980 UF-70]
MGPVDFPSYQISTDVDQNTSAGESVRSKDQNLPDLSGNDSEIVAEELPQVAPSPHADIPNGGIVAWLQVVGINMFGAFQTFYESDLLSHESPSNVSWIGSIQAFLLLLVGVITGPLFDAGLFRPLLSTGTFLVVFGMMMTSISKTYWEIILAQAVCMGIGLGCLFVPSVAIVSTYFSTRKAFATGIAASGSSLGGVIYPIIFHNLQPKIGFGWTTRALGFIFLATLTISMSIMKMRIKPSQKRKLIDLAAFKEPPYILFTMGLFFGFMGLNIPFYYISSYAIDEKIMSSNSAFYMLSTINAASIFGRIIPNYFADKFGPLNIIIPGTLIASVVAFSWTGIDSVGGLVVFAILYGFSTGCFVSIPPTVIVSLSPHLGVVGTRMGMTFAIGGLGLLIGTPVAGQILSNSGYVSTIAFCGALLLATVACFVAARLCKTGIYVKKFA